MKFICLGVLTIFTGVFALADTPFLSLTVTGETSEFCETPYHAVCEIGPKTNRSTDTACGSTRVSTGWTSYGYQPEVQSAEDVLTLIHEVSSGHLIRTIPTESISKNGSLEYVAISPGNSRPIELYKSNNSVAYRNSQTAAAEKLIKYINSVCR